MQIPAGHKASAVFVVRSAIFIVAEFSTGQFTTTPFSFSTDVKDKYCRRYFICMRQIVVDMLCLSLLSFYSFAVSLSWVLFSTCHCLFGSQLPPLSSPSMILTDLICDITPFFLSSLLATEKSHLFPRLSPSLSPGELSWY